MERKVVWWVSHVVLVERIHLPMQEMPETQV